jgi:small subunit ribosomal protein S2
MLPGFFRPMAVKGSKKFMPEVSLKTLIETGAHFGHQTKRWNPKMDEFLYGEKEGVHIFDLVKTKALLDEALNFLRETAKAKKTILFVGTKKQAKEKVKEVALETESFFINERWLGGILTNFAQIKKTTQKLTDFRKNLVAGEYKNRTKKERLLIEREIDKLEKFFGGLVGMAQIPDVLIIIDVKRESTAVKEAAFKDVETVAVVDSNSDPTNLDYPIPMNDDAGKAVEYVLDLFKDAILEGKGIKKPVAGKRLEVSDKKEKQEKKKTEKKVAKPKSEKSSK